MPEFNVLQPLVETVDRRGTNFNAGLGNANTSPLGSFLEGFNKGRKEFTDTSIAQLEAQVAYAPDKILADQVARELDNDRVRAAIRESRIKSDLAEKFGERETLADIRQTEASTALTGQNTRFRRAEASLLEEFGRDKELLDLYEKTTKLADGSSNGLKERELALKQRTENRQLAKNRSDALISLGLDTPVRERIEKLQTDRAEAEEAGDLERVGSIDVAIGDEFKQAEDLGLIPKSFSGEPSERPTREDIRQSVLSSGMDDLTNTVDNTDFTKSFTDLEIAKHAANRQNENASVSKDAFTKATLEAKAFRFAMMMDSPNAALTPLGRMFKYASQAPAEIQGTLVGELAHAVRDKRHVEKLQEVVDREPDPKLKTEKQKLLDGILVTTGNIEFLRPVQKDLANIYSNATGVTPEDITDRLSNVAIVKQDLATLITGDGASVEDRLLKDAVELDRLTIAAREASKNGTQGFKVFAGVQTASSEGGADVAGAPSGDQDVITFIGEDGTQKFAPTIIKGSPEEPFKKSLMNMYQQVGASLSAQGKSDQLADANTQQVAERNQLLQGGQPAPAPEAGVPTGSRSKNPDPTQIRSPFNTSRLIRQVGFVEGQRGLVSDKTAKSLDSLLRSVEDGTFTEGAVFNTQDERNLNIFFENSLDDLWAALPDQEKKVFIDFSRPNPDAVNLKPIGELSEANQKFVRRKGKDAFFSIMEKQLKPGLKTELKSIATEALRQRKAEVRQEEDRVSNIASPIARTLENLRKTAGKTNG